MPPQNFTLPAVPEPAEVLALIVVAIAILVSLGIVVGRYLR